MHRASGNIMFMNLLSQQYGFKNILEIATKLHGSSRSGTVVSYARTRLDIHGLNFNFMLFERY